MSLETLLEAAEFLEWRNQSKTRGDGSPRDPHGYSVISTNDSDASPESSNSGKFSGNDESKEKRRMGGAGTREVHNKLEKNRRAHLKECFEFLKNQIPTLEDKRTSNLSILRVSLKYIQALRRKEKEYELEMQRLAREKIYLQERISHLKTELAKMNIEVDLNQWVTVPEEQDTNSTSTATEQGSPICSEEDEEDELPPLRPKPAAMYSEQQMKRLAGLPAQPDISTPSKPAQLQLKPLTTHASMTVLKVTTPVTASNRNPATIASMVQSAAVPQSTVGSSVIQQQIVSASRPPVTQILAQALNQRQQRQQSNAQVSTVYASSTSSARAQNPVKSIPPQIRHPLTLTPLTAQLQGATPAHLAALNKLAGTAALSLPVSSIASGPSSSMLNKSLGGPILVSPSIHLASAAGMAGIGSALNLASTASAQVSSTASSILSAASVKTSMAQNTVTTTAVTMASQVTLATPTLSAMRSTVIGTAGTHQLMAGHLTPLNTLLAQTVPRTSIANQILPGVSNVVGTTQSTSSVQVMSLAQMAPGTPIMSPMTMMAPSGLHLAAAASGLSQTQLNSMLNQQPLLKQIPIFSPGILQTGGQMIGQPVVKPLVFVTVPSMVATTTAPSIQVTTTTS